MPDLNGGRKLTSKSGALKKSDVPSKTSHSSSVKAGDKRKAERGVVRTPPKRRGARRSSSSSSGTSDSSSSGSDSSDSSASASSASSKESPKKMVQSKRKEAEQSRPPARDQKLKTDATTAAASKPDETRTQREQPVKKPVSGDGPKSSDGTRGDTQARSKPSATTEESQATTPPKSRGKTSTESRMEPPKSQPISELPAKPPKPNIVEADNAVKQRSKSPPGIPPFTRVLVEKLTRNVNKAHVTEIFSVWGEVLNVEMPPDRLHPEFSRSYAYVTYKDPKSAADAVNFMNGGQVDGELIRVSEVFTRPSTSARSGADTNAKEPSHHRDRGPSRRETDRPTEANRDRRDNPPPAVNRRAEDSGERNRDRPSTNDLDRRREIQDRRDRDRERQRDRSRDMDRPRRMRRGSSGSPFAGRLGPSARQRSPVAGSRYRRASPLSSRPNAMPNRGRSRSPRTTKPGAPPRPTGDTKTAGRRGRKASRSSSSSSSDSGTSSSSSSSRSGSSSSSSSSSSSRSKS